jgi:hypothetical protein
MVPKAGETGRDQAHNRALVRKRGSGVILAHQPVHYLVTVHERQLLD